MYVCNPSVAECETRSIFKHSKTSSNSELSFSKAGCVCVCIYIYIYIYIYIWNYKLNRCTKKKIIFDWYCTSW